VSNERARAERDPEAAAKAQILATEHWSLLAARTLTYNESLSRVTIFLAILSGAVIALALVAQADHFGATFITIAIPVLLVVLFAGIATIARLTALNRDDYRWVIGMNRIRHAYLDLQPDLEPNFITSPYDDLDGALQTLGVEGADGRRGLGSVFHLLQTLPGMLMVIVAAVGGAIGGLVAVALGLTRPAALLIAAVGFVAVIVFMAVWSRRSFGRPSPGLEPRFPSPRG
jgi:hypothetical protein